MKNLLVLLPLLTTLALASPPKPNVLFICIDDLVPTLGCYGDPYAQTPNIDAVASEGTTFLNHHTQWAVCGPSRAALTTGLMPEETGVMGFRPIRALLPDVITLPQHFRNQGYETACAGKFHDNRTVGTIINPDTGTSGGSSTDDLLSWSIPFNNGGSGYAPPNAASGSKQATNYNFLATSPTNESDYTDGKILDAGLNFIDQVAAGTKPFFVSVGFKKPHLAFVAPKAYWDLYNPSNAPLSTYDQLPLNASTYVNDTLSNNSELYGYAPFDTTYPSNTALTPTVAEKQELIHGYYACVSFIDSLVGQLTTKLSTTADPVQAGKMMDETTIVVIWGDHGFGLGEHGKWAKHTNMDRASLCPLIIYDPRNATTGNTTTAPAQTVDIYPTLCELSGLSTPTQPIDEVITSGRPLAGRSLVPVLNDPTVSVNTGAVTITSQNGETGYAYRTQDYRYIEWIDSSGNIDAYELYDLTRDQESRRAVYRVDTNDPTNDIIDANYESVIFALSKSLRNEVSTQNPARFWDSGTDTYSSAPNRLQLSTPPLSTLTQDRVPFTCLNTVSNQLCLEWSPLGVPVKLIHNTDLSTTWNTYQDHLTGSEHVFPVTQTKEFFHVALSANDQPVFSQDPVVLPAASSGAAYSASLASYVSDPNAGDTISYVKVDGPSWGSISPSGVLTGTPTSTDECPAYFTVRAEDNHGAYRLAKVHVDVAPSAPSLTTQFNASDDSYAKQSDPTGNFGTANQIQLRQDGASSVARLGYVKLSVTGTTNITSAKLYLYAEDETDQINIHAVSDNTWTEAALTWGTKPTTGTLLGSATPSAGTWFSVDVSSFVNTNGTFSFVLDEQGNSAGKLRTKEGGNTPYLEIIHQ